MKWIVGLGNPGFKYGNTRHNVGFMVLDRLADNAKIAWKKSKFTAQVGEGHIGGVEVRLLKPLTYMNLSGQAMKMYQDFFKLDLADLIVIYDDVDTELGQIRLRYQGSSGGHNGLKSVIECLGTQQFNRVRVGISRPNPHEIVDYVLQPFAKSEKEAIGRGLELAVEATLFALEHPFDKAMAKFNGKG